jgi:hypothetical protein
MLEFISTGIVACATTFGTTRDCLNRDELLNVHTTATRYSDEKYEFNCLLDTAKDILNKAAQNDSVKTIFYMEILIEYFEPYSKSSDETIRVCASDGIEFFKAEIVVYTYRPLPSNSLPHQAYERAMREWNRKGTENQAKANSAFQKWYQSSIVFWNSCN